MEIAIQYTGKTLRENVDGCEILDTGCYSSIR